MNSTFEELLTIAEKTLKYKKDNSSPNSYSNLRSTLLGAMHSAIDQEELINKVTTPETPYDVRSFVLTETNIVKKIPEALAKTFSYETLLNTPVDWIKEKNKNIYPKAKKGSFPDIRTFKKTEYDNFNLKTNVQNDFFAKVLLTEATSYSESQIKLNLVREYKYENRSLSEFQYVVSGAGEDVVEYCLNSDYSIHSAMLVYNEQVTFEVYEELVKNSELIVIHSLLRQPNVPTSLLTKIYNKFNEDKLTKVLLAQHLNTSSETIEKLTYDEDEDIQNVAFKNPNLPADTIQKMSETNYIVSRQLVSKNMGTPISILSDFLNNDNEDPVVRFNALFNPSLPKVYKNIFFSFE